MKTRPIWIAPMMGLVLLACGPQSPAGMPDVGVASEALNSEIRVFTPEGKTFKRNERISLTIDVVGTRQVVFAPDFGQRMFLYQNGDWVEVADLPTEYAGGPYILSPSHGDPFMWGDTSVYPMLPEMEEPVWLRIFVLGRVLKYGEPSDEVVGGYVDVLVEP